MEHVIQHLKELRLNQMVKILDEVIQEAEREGLDPLEVLARLADAQVVINRDKATERRIKEARFPDRKTLDDFNFDFQPTLDRGRVMALARLDFIRRRENVLLGGNSGTGKSHIGKALALLACGAGFRVRFTTCEDLFHDLYAAQCDHTLPVRLKYYTLPDLLMIDDLGFERIEIKQAGNANLLLKVVNARYEKKSTIITSNISLDKWGDYLGDAAMAMATLDRFIHHAALFHIDGPSWRDRECRQMLINQPQSEGNKGDKPAPRAPRAKRTKEVTQTT
jgi:DNA replication protein DnaC